MNTVPCTHVELDLVALFERLSGLPPTFEVGTATLDNDCPLARHLGATSGGSWVVGMDSYECLSCGCSFSLPLWADCFVDLVDAFADWFEVSISASWALVLLVQACHEADLVVPFVRALPQALPASGSDVSFSLVSLASV